MESIETVLAKLTKAQNARENKGFKSKLEDAYYYCCPRRYNKDEDSAKEIYDSTAIYAVQARVANNHQMLFPAFREWIYEEPVNKYSQTDEVKIFQQLKERSRAAHKAVELSNFHIEIEDTLTDAMFSDGAILVFMGTPECPLRFQVPAWNSFFTLNDMNGEPNNNFMIRELSVEEIKYYWPKADTKNLSDKKDAKITVIDGYTYDETKNVYTYSVMIGNERIYVSEEKSSPWVIFNQKRRGSVKCGWGQVLDSLPDTKTLNKIEQLLLQHAAINVAGIWQAEDDGVLNPDNIKLEPGTIVPIAPGSKGLQPLHTSLNMNLAQFVLGDLKENIKKNVQGSALPSFNDGVRTASEYQMRDAEMRKTEIPAMMQLAQGSKRLMKRIFYILESNKMKTSTMFCKPVYDSNNKVVQTSFSSPLSRMQREIETKSGLQLVATMANIFGQAATDVIDLDNFIKDYYLYNNFDPNRLLSKEEINGKREKNNQEAMALAQAGVKQQTPTPGNISF